MAVVALSLLYLALCVTGMGKANAESSSGDLFEVVLSLKKEVTELTRKNEEQDRKIAQQEKQISLLKWKSDEQETDRKEFKKKIGELENDILTLNKKNAKQENEVKEKNTAGKENSVTKLKKKTNNLLNESEELTGNAGERGKETTEQRIATQDLNDNHYIGERQVPERVAFSLYLSHDQTHADVGNKIKFDTVLLNEGNGYNTNIDAFVAPTRGIYLFAYSIGKFRVGEAFVRLMKNGNAINGAAVDVRANTADEHASNVAIIELDVGDIVYVEEYHTNDVLILGSSSLRWTTFSGVLLI